MLATLASASPHTHPARRSITHGPHNPLTHRLPCSRHGDVSQRNEENGAADARTQRRLRSRRSCAPNGCGPICGLRPRQRGPPPRLHPMPAGTSPRRDATPPALSAHLAARPHRPPPALLRRGPATARSRLRQSRSTPWSASPSTTPPPLPTSPLFSVAAPPLQNTSSSTANRGFMTRCGAQLVFISHSANNFYKLLPLCSCRLCIMDGTVHCPSAAMQLLYSSWPGLVHTVYHPTATSPQDRCFFTFGTVLFKKKLQVLIDIFFLNLLITLMEHIAPQLHDFAKH